MMSFRWVVDKRLMADLLQISSALKERESVPSEEHGASMRTRSKRSADYRIEHP